MVIANVAKNLANEQQGRQGECVHANKININLGSYSVSP